MKMKKIFISFLALVAIVGVANAQRTWAYDLNSTQEGDAYTFEFKATTAATTANLVLVDVDGNEVAKLPLENVVAGANSVTLELAKLHKDAVNWAVELTGEAIVAGETLAEVTDQSRGIYDFYNMKDVLVDNNPESEYFGKIYIQMALSGASDGMTNRSKTQTAGFFIYDQELNELNPTSNVGILPTVPDGYVLGTTRFQFHRLDIDPKTGDLVFCYNVANQPAVFAVNPADLAGEVTNLVTGVEGLTRTCAHCYDAEGTLYVMDIAESKGAIYKIVDGQAVQMTEPTGKWVNSEMTLAADGKGGVWVAQNRGQIDGYYQLVHVTSTGVIDWSVYDDLGTYSSTTLGTSSTGWTGSSSRGALAYDAERQILAQGRSGVVELFNVTYDAETGVPTLTKFAVTPTVGNNIDGLHFDYAGDLYVVNSSNEKFQKFAVPTAENTCTTPAKSSLVITGGTATSVDNVAISVDAQKIIRNGQVLIIRDGKTFNMLGQEVK